MESGIAKKRRTITGVGIATMNRIGSCPALRSRCLGRASTVEQDGAPKRCVSRFLLASSGSRPAGSIESAFKRAAMFVLGVASVGLAGDERAAGPALALLKGL